MEVSKSEIKYKKQSNLEGPTFVVSTEELISIIYANGEVQLFTNQKQVQQEQQEQAKPAIVTQPTTTQPTLTNEQQKNLTPTPINSDTNNKPIKHYKNSVQNKTVKENVVTISPSNDIQLDNNKRPYIKRNMFNMYADVGMIVCGDRSLGASTNFTFGCRINDYVFVGGSIGYDYFNDLDYWYDYNGSYYDNGYGYTQGHVVTEMENVRVYIPIRLKVYSYFETSVGVSVLCLNTIPTTFRLKLGIGLDISRFSFGLGYDFLCGTSFSVNNYPYYHWDSHMEWVKEYVDIDYDIHSKHSFYVKLGIKIGSMQ